MAAKETDCIKRDVCIFHNCGSTSNLCKDCGHYISEAQNTSTNSIKAEIAALANEVEQMSLLSEHEQDFDFIIKRMRQLSAV
jgi:hypothetical protein